MKLLIEKKKSLANNLDELKNIKEQKIKLLEKQINLKTKENEDIISNLSNNISNINIELKLAITNREFKIADTYHTRIIILKDKVKNIEKEFEVEISALKEQINNLNGSISDISSSNAGDFSSPSLQSSLSHSTITLPISVSSNTSNPSPLFCIEISAGNFSRHKKENHSVLDNKMNGDIKCEIPSN